MHSASPPQLLAGGQRPQHLGVDQHGDRLVERADQVLADRVVHAPIFPPTLASTIASSDVGI